MIKARAFSPPGSRQGLALVISLGFIALLTILVLSYFTVTQIDRRSTQNYSQSVRAQDLAQGALEEIKDDLLMEINAGSLPDGTPAGASYTWNGVRVFVPASALASQPVRIGFASTDYATDVDADKLPPTLVRVSRSGSDRSAIYPTTVFNQALLPPDRVSPAKTDTPSANGRRITPDRWNKPKLLGEGPPTAFKNNPPEWVYVTRGGSSPYLDADAAALKAKSNLADQSQALGRYAYVVYDEGGLLDVNAVGHPSNWVPTDTGEEGEAVRSKSAPAYANLLVLPGMSGKNSALDDFIAWRSRGAVTRWHGFLKSIPENLKLGFLEFQPGDSPLLSRQDLIDYFAEKFGTVQPLAYLGTFSREVNAPSWKPTQDTLATYAARAENPSSENRNLANVRAADGKPLIKRRFPLSRLALLSHSAIAGTADPIYAYFGLTRGDDSVSWTYDHGHAGAILTLEEVKDKGREPDFFELLKAVILDGSLGRDPGGGLNPLAEVLGQQGNLNSTGPSGQYFGQQPSTTFAGYSAIPDRQIIQIGANIIDQSDEDSLPTSIYFNAVANPAAFSANLNTLFNTLAGVENLPYPFALRALRWRDPAANAPNGQHHAWFQPALWNPHQQLPAGYSGTKPSAFRLRIYGRSQISDWAGSGTGSLALTSDRFMDYDSPKPAYTDFQYISFSDSLDAASPFLNNPQFLDTSLAGSPNAINVWKTAYGLAAGQFVGFYAGNMTAKETFKPTPANPPNTHKDWGAGLIVGANSPTTITIVAEYQDASGRWWPYAQYARYNAFSGHGWNPETQPALDILGGVDMSRPDPRTDRFSVAMGWDGIAKLASQTARTNSYWPSSSISRRAAAFVPAPNSRFVYPGNSLRTGYWAANLQGALPYYEDPDGEVRPGDAWRGSGAEGMPTFSGDATHARRPAILNRAFRSVGELGYAFRDLPFKSLDFWSPASADAGLLDVFCLEEEPETVAGRINPNSAPAPVFEAVLSGAYKKANDPQINIGAEASTLAKAIAKYIQDNGFLSNRADLVTAANGTASLSSSMNAAFTDSADKANKVFAEAPVRALAPVTNTRTWNLLVDVIAQSGKMAPNADGLDKFLVEGERRYWLHVAIDRYTGKIVGQQLEPVYE